MTKERKGECRSCGQIQAVTARGVMRQHTVPASMSAARWRPTCTGTGEPPAAYLDDEGEARTREPLIPAPEGATVHPGGGWCITPNSLVLFVPGHPVCAARSSEALGDWACTGDNWPHDWHVGEGADDLEGRSVCAVWPATDEEKQEWARMLRSARDVGL